MAASTLRATDFKIEWSVSGRSEDAVTVPLGSAGAHVPGEYEQGPQRQPCRVLLELASDSISGANAGCIEITSNSAAIEVHELMPGAQSSCMLMSLDAGHEGRFAAGHPACSRNLAGEWSETLPSSHHGCWWRTAWVRAWTPSGKSSRRSVVVPRGQQLCRTGARPRAYEHFPLPTVVAPCIPSNHICPLHIPPSLHAV